jgi:hypothetical protein
MGERFEVYCLFHVFGLMFSKLVLKNQVEAWITLGISKDNCSLKMSR